MALRDYEEVKDRLPRFWADHPSGAVRTEMVYRGEGVVIFKAWLCDENGVVISDGHAEEVYGQGKVNEMSALENCETSAIGRALGNAKWASGPNRPSREEMEKVARGVPMPAPGGGETRRPAAAPQSRKGKPPPGKWQNDPATDSQRNTINKLVDKTGLVPETWPLPEKLTKGEAGEIIDRLQAEPKEPLAERVSTLRQETYAAAEEFVG